LKRVIASDRTSCRSPLANQVRLVLHTGAYGLMLKLRDAIPRPQPLAVAEFTTLRVRLIKIAARIVETASRVRVAFAAAHPEAALFAASHAVSNRPGHDRRGMCPATARSRQPPTPNRYVFKSR
jgi:Transposase DDE domain group 1